MPRARSNAEAKWFIIRVIIGLAMIGALTASRSFIIFMNKLNPLQGLIVWYSLLAIALFIIFHGKSISIAGLGTRSLGFVEIIATLMIVWAFQIVLGVESPWAAQASNLDPNQVPQVLYQSEDGVTYVLLYNLLWSLSPYFPNIIWKTYPDFIAFMTYVITPIILVLLASLILTTKKFQTTVTQAARF